jgi:hypothetical protein
MDMIVLCQCGHPSALHNEHGCRAGRYRPCACLLDAEAAVAAAIDLVRAGPSPVMAAKMSALHK